MNKEEIENLEEEKIEKKNNHSKHKNNKEIEKLKNENAILNEKILRIAAEMQNMKRRYEEEISKIYKYEGEAFIKNVLSVVDNFERAINMDNNVANDELSKFLNGFILICNELKTDLVNVGVTEIECLDKPFNPLEMEAMMTEKVDGKEAGIVTSVLLKGYKYKDKVIRPAMVRVSE